MLNKELTEKFFDKKREYKNHLERLQNSPIGINSSDPHDEVRQTVTNRMAIDGTKKIIEVIVELENEYWLRHNV